MQGRLNLQKVCGFCLKVDLKVDLKAVWKACGGHEEEGTRLDGGGKQ